MSKNAVMYQRKPCYLAESLTVFNLKSFIYFKVYSSVRMHLTLLGIFAPIRPSHPEVEHV